MYYVYLLKNENGQFYIGYSNDLKRRLAEHKAEKVKTTKRLGFSELVYYEAYTDESSAKNREQKLKQFGSSYSGLIKRLNLK
ncbi:MAG: GIY-YIG nuclease family protein [Candidatus Doudnabacteria bacterium]|jgi:putative endonuclease